MTALGWTIIMLTLGLIGMLTAIALLALRAAGVS